MIRRAISVVVIASALAGCSTALGLSAEQVLSDTAMTTAIKTRLAKEEGFETLSDIGVSTTDDMVTLSGTVDSEADKQRIAEIARRIAGDNKLQDQLRVVGSPAAAPRPAAQKE